MLVGGLRTMINLLGRKVERGIPLSVEGTPVKGAFKSCSAEDIEEFITKLWAP